MAGPLQTMRKFWSSLTGRAEPMKPPQVLVHDPAAQRAHDLDDPFYDNEVQSRIADVIASTGNRKTKNSI